jgi:hypothetical protein
VSFQLKDPVATRAKLKQSDVIASTGGHLRISVSVFNNIADVGRLIKAQS